MNKGLYTASVGMITQMNKMDVVSNNIANVNTAGYKKDNVVTRSFEEEMYLRINDQNAVDMNIVPSGRSIGTLNNGNNVDMIYTDFTSGSLENTGNQLDLAIDGEGFFSVNYVDANGNVSEKYTRDGGFTLGPNGELLTHDSFAVLDENGAPIVLPSNSIPSFSDNGTVFVDGEAIAKLKITKFADSLDLRKYGTNLYDVTEGAETEPFTGKVLQGFKEMSNVNSVKEMVEMITLSRAYEACSKCIETQDSIMSKMANDIGRKL